MLPSIRFGRRLLFPLILLMGLTVPALAIDFTAYWAYRANGGEAIDTQDELQQRYTLILGPSLEYRPTHAITASASIGYSRSEQDLGRGSGRETVEDITPAAELSLVNDIFNSSVSGYYTSSRPSKGTDFTTEGWDVTLGSGSFWTRPFVPAVQFSYSERHEYTDDNDAFDALDTTNETIGASVDWDLQWVQLFYDYTSDSQENQADGSQNDSDTHFVRLETEGTFWDKRVSFNFAQQYQHTANDISFTGPQFDLELEAATGSAATNPDTLRPEDPDFEFLQLAANPRLRDGNLGEAALTVPDPDGDPDVRRIHLGVSLDFAEFIGALHVYVDPFGGLAGEQAAALQWDLYFRDFAEAPWELLAAAIPARFDAAENRLVLEVNRFDREIMVVATLPFGQQLAVTELQAVRVLTEATSTTTTTHLSDLSVRAYLTPTLLAYSSLSYELSDNEAGDRDSEATHLAVNGSLTWTPTPYVTPSLSFSETRDEVTGQPDLLSRSYGVTVATYPLPTLNVTVGATRTERYEDDDKNAESTSYNLITSARIYPDLNASLYLSYNDNQRWDDDGDATSSDALSSRLTITARLFPALTADLTGSYRTTDSDTGDSTSVTDTVASLQYRPSDLLSARLTNTHTWSGAEAPDLWVFNLNLGVVRTQKARLTLNYLHRYSDQDDPVDRVGLDGSWDLSRALSFQTRMNYIMAETNNWNVEAYLTLRL